MIFHKNVEIKIRKNILTERQIKMIAVQVSIYPVGEKDVKSRLDIFWSALKNENIDFKITPLSTIAWSENEDSLYRTIFKAYKKVRKTCKVVMVTTTAMGSNQEINELLSYLG